MRKRIHLFGLVFTLLIFTFSALSCRQEKPSNTEVEKTANDTLPDMRKIQSEKIAHLLDSLHLKGSVLIFNPKENVYFSNDFFWADIGWLPASTFKIPNALIGMDLGVISDSTVFKWDGKERMFDNWERDLNLKDAFHVSCVPCFQELARKIGYENMKKYTDSLRFGEMRVTPETLDHFWLEGNSNISQFQQIDFLQRLSENRLPLKKETQESFKNLMIISGNNSYTLRGKTGLNITQNKLNGWFTGYITTTANEVFYFATNVESDDLNNRDLFINQRKEITLESFKLLNLIK